MGQSICQLLVLLTGKSDERDIERETDRQTDRRGGTYTFCGRGSLYLRLGLGLGSVSQHHVICGLGCTQCALIVVVQRLTDERR